MEIEKQAKKLKNIYIQSEISRYIFHIILSILLGILSGIGAILFHYLLENMRLFFHPDNFTKSFNINFYFIFIVPAIGALVVCLLSEFFKDVAEDRGVAGVIKSIIIKNGYIPIKTTIFHFFAPIISIGTGAPLGPEGPAAKMGSGIGSFMSRSFRLNKKDMKMYTAAGAGAAISAIFNAPIAGVFFGIEVILMNDLKNQALSALIISCVVSDILSRSVLGVSHIMNIPAYSHDIISHFPFIILMGIMCGVVSMIYFWIKKETKIIIDEKLKLKNIYLKLVPLSLIFGVIIIKYYDLFGIGYKTIDKVINSGLMIDTVIVLLVLKIIFLALFINAGAYGGTFAPSLSIGVMLGFVFAYFMNFVFNAGLDPVVFSLIGMGGVLAGINSIPLTSILLVFELTNDYKFILPLMLTSIMAYLVTIYYNKGTIYVMELLKSGIDVTKRGEVDLLGRIKVRDLVIREFDTVSYRMPFKDLVNVLLKSSLGYAVVVDDNDCVIGVLSLNDIRQAIISDYLTDVIIAGDITSSVPDVTEEDKVSWALRQMELYELECIPVICSDDRNKIAGIITHRDIAQAYNTLLENWETDQFLINYKV